MTERICPACGCAVAASMKFCPSCGTPMEDLSQQGKVPSALGVCQSCGAPATTPGQKFCAACGGKMGGMPQAAPVSTGAALSSTALGSAPASSASLTESPLKVDMAQMRSRFDDFMGASVDVSSVGKNFDPQSIVLSGDNDPLLIEAFAFFNKVYLAPSEEPAEMQEEILAPRSEPAEARPQEMKRREHSTRKGGLVCGEMTTKLQISAAPTVQMLGDVREKALEQQNKNRQKRKAVLDAQ